MLKTFDYDKMPVVEVVNEIMIDASKRGASDIHFDPLENVMKIRIRIDGTLIDYTLVPNDIKKNLITRIKIISGMNITESRLPQDGAIKATVQGVNLDMRVSTIPTNMGEKIVIRILDYSLSGAGIENLGFSQENYKKVIEMINQPNGIILVTGATGTGKSTTVYSILQRLNKESTNIVTVEDPVEMNIEGINQIQANSEIGLDFATALRSILRQDPNIIMIGEIRDTETAKIAIRASITGHLVLSTLHTNDSLNTIERLLDMDVERYLLASSLAGIIAQKLARQLCPHCRKLRKTNKYEQKLFESVLGHSVEKIYSPIGCDLCHNGYTGRIAIQEVLLINQQIRDAISSNVRKDKLRNLVYTTDVASLLQDGLAKVEEGLTSIEELIKLIELENEDSSIARMGLDASIKLAQEVEDSVIIEETPVVNENKKEVKDTKKEVKNVIDTKKENDVKLDVLLNNIREDIDNKTKKKKENENIEIIETIEPKLEEIVIDNNSDKENIVIEDNETFKNVIDTKPVTKPNKNNKKKDDIASTNVDDLIIGDVENISIPDDLGELPDLNIPNIVDDAAKELNNIKVEPIIELDAAKEELQEGSLDDDLSNASDDDIMNLFD